MKHTQPIPLCALQHTMTVQEPDTSSSYDGKYLAPATVENVRFEYKESLNPKVYQLAENAKGRIWVDAVNSYGAYAVSRGAKVKVNDEEMKVLTCAPYETFNGHLHHWELDVG